MLVAGFAFIGAAAMTVASCGVVTGSGTTVTRDLDLGGFSKVEVRSGFEVRVTRAETHAVSLRVDDNVVEYLDVEVDGDTLRLGLDAGTSYRDATLTAVVELPALEALELSGASGAEVAGFEGDGPLRFDLSGDSTLECLGVPRLGTVTTSGDSEVRRVATPSPQSSGASPAAVTPLGGGWTAVAPGESQIGGVSFVDVRRGWAASRGQPADRAADDGVCRTEDGGEYWSLVSKADGAVGSRLRQGLVWISRDQALSVDGVASTT